MLKVRRLLILYAVLAPSLAQAQSSPQSEARTMSFSACLQVIRDTSSQLRVAPVNIVETNIMRMVRFPTRDGSVLITCSAPDNRMVVTTSRN